jgi:t-SNARE complex subunit (syntaxin)
MDQQMDQKIQKSNDDIANRIAEERNKELQQIEQDISYLEETNTIIAEQIKEQGKQLDKTENDIESSVNKTTEGNKDLIAVNNRSYFWRSIAFIGGSLVVGTTVVMVAVLKRH